MSEPRPTLRSAAERRERLANWLALLALLTLGVMGPAADGGAAVSRPPAHCCMPRPGPVQRHAPADAGAFRPPRACRS
jgi:hypothetical protein